jgi:hypothetical protein
MHANTNSAVGHLQRRYPHHDLVQHDFDHHPRTLTARLCTR